MATMPPIQGRTTKLEALAVTGSEAERNMNRLAAAGIPFLFFVDAWAEKWVVGEYQKMISSGILWNIQGRGPLGVSGPPPQEFFFKSQVVDRLRYRRGFDVLRRGQVAGETYLANLTFPSLLDTNLDLEAFARCSRADFRLYVPDHFTVFSPERFVSVDDSGIIRSYPMKGTIDASVPNAAERILADPKESAEHVTIVDLIRNDLGRVSRGVDVPRYRFITEVKARNRHLLQVSSEVRGALGDEWRMCIGSTLRSLLPAGSVTGAPKKRTCQLIREAEGYDRGWYTGVFGVFDGVSLDSGVMIRFIEHDKKGRLVYKSGGGITIYSDMDSEYAELEAKVYAPFG